MNKKIRPLESRFVALSLMWLLSAPLVSAPADARERFAQQDQPPPQTSNQEEPLVAPVHPVMAQRVGVDPNQILRLSLHDAILMALEKNNTIQVERTNVQIAGYNLASLRGTYDILIGGSGPGGSFIQWTSDKRPSNGPNFIFNESGQPAFIGGQGFNETETFQIGYAASQQLPWLGTQWRFTIQDTRTLIKNPNTSLINPFYSSRVGIDITQPLWKNFRIDQTRSQIRIAQKSIDLSDSLFRQRVIEIITQVQQAYWNLVFAIRAVGIQQQALDLAKTNLENNRKQVEAGTTAPIELAQSEAQVEQSRQDLITAVGNVTTAENALKMLIIGDPKAPEWKANIAPTESIEHLAPVIDFESAVNLALANRPELEQLRLQKEQRDIDIKLARNQTRPQIDLIATYALNGLKGSIVESQLERVISQLPEEEAAATRRALSGGPGSSLRQAFGRDFQTISFGFTLNFPLRNRTAEATLGRVLAQRRSLDFQDNQLTQSITTEVRNALQNVQTARQTIEAARAARIARQTQLDGEQKKFEAGLSTTFFVLQFQTFLSQAQLAELQALVNYNNAIANLQRVMSTTLSAHNVEITPRPTGK